MYFYEVFISSQRYHGNKPLTYSASMTLPAGSIVSVPLGKQSATGFILKATTKPTFSTKEILEVLQIQPISTQLRQLHSWMLEYYPGPSGICTQLFIPSGLGTTSRRKTAAKQRLQPVELPPLTKEQRDAINTIQSGKSGPYLLHGETGSGKTRVYLELTKQTLQSGRSAIILTPEIGLTTQLANRFVEAFPDRVTLIHSGQTAAERRDNWRSIAANESPQVIIGPRSSLFAPTRSVGLIILDECHDAAYKQDSMPHYQTTRVAAVLSRLHQATLLLGSATPLISDYYAFRQKSLPIIRMEQLATGTGELTTKIVDLKDRQQFSKSVWLSNSLLEDIESAIQNGYQSLLFLNRRGTARLVLCDNCGWQAVCPRCDLPVTYHGDKHALQCHTCGYSSKTPLSCPDCQKPEITFRSIGTKTLLQELQRLFPEASIARFDSDNTKSESLTNQFSSVLSGKIDIMVGTQVLAKGLDLPLLQVVGVVLADTGLYFPDYSAEERTFQMLHQVIGRVGRGHIPGKVTLQSYNPDSSPIKAAINRDYESFYESQIEERKLYRFPPHYFVLKIVVERATQSKAMSTAQEICTQLVTARLAVELSGPAPAFVEKSNNKYRWQIIVKAKQRGELVKAVALLPATCSYDIDPNNLL